jgi:hypothetical protein
MSDLFETPIATGTPEAHNPGGKVMIPLAPDVTGRAEFGGPNDCYRYRLSPSQNGGKLALRCFSESRVTTVNKFIEIAVQDPRSRLKQ